MIEQKLRQQIAMLVAEFYNVKYKGSKFIQGETPIKYALLVNSGSSANLLALSALTSHLLKDRRLKPGDEVIIIVAGFLTTVNPIIQNSLVPGFVDKEYEGNIHRHISGSRQRVRPLHNSVKLMEYDSSMLLPAHRQAFYIPLNAVGCKT